MPNQSLGRRRLLQIKLFFCLFHHFNSPQCEIWTCQQMASVLCLAAGGRKVPQLRQSLENPSRAWHVHQASVQPGRARPLPGTTTLGRSGAADPTRDAQDTLSTRPPRTTWPDPSDDPTRLLFTPRNHLGTNRLEKNKNKNDWRWSQLFFLTLLATCSVNSKKLKSWHVPPASEHLWEMETAQWRRHQKDDQKDILSLSETRDGGNCPAHLSQARGTWVPSGRLHIKVKLELTSFSVRSCAASWACIFTHTLLLWSWIINIPYSVPLWDFSKVIHMLSSATFFQVLITSSLNRSHLHL